ALFATELPSRVGSHPRRWASFRGGRACARAALRALGLPAVAIPVGTAGAPIWPQGFVGSISHTDNTAAPTVAESPPIEALGLDVEGDEPLDNASMVKLVCRREELVPGFDPSDAANLRRGKLLFVVKEAIYKLYWPLAKTFLDFHEVSVTLDESKGRFRAAIIASKQIGVFDHGPLSGSFARSEGLIIALASRLNTQSHTPGESGRFPLQ